ncbi:MAG: linked oxidase domain protein [Actinomycetia bacterium]|nr:linked oxidase domain protein [Actinomycetes bacterium]
MGDDLIERLRAAVGPQHLLVDPDLRAPYETDWTGRWSGRARAVVRPADAHQLADVLRICLAAGAPAIAQGGNTGLVGGGVPRGGGSEVVVSLARLDGIGPVDGSSGDVVVGAGATLARVQEAARAAGWDVGVDLAARDSATIGGMVATNAGGVHVLRYGGMVEQVIGLEAVTMAGEVLGRVPALRKDNSGYHWPALLAGSEGTLAVVTRIHLKLVPHLPDRVVALLGLPDLDALLAVAGRLRRGLPSLRALEVMFADGVTLTHEYNRLPLPLPGPPPVVLLVEVADAAGTRSRLFDALGALVADDPDVLATAVADDELGARRLWRTREDHTEAINAAGIPHKLDVTLPTANLAPFADEVRALVTSLAPAARLVLFGHVGDGNLHVNLLGLVPDDDSVDHAVLDLVARLGGSISAEHGIGVAKRADLPLTRTGAEIATMRAIKAALDPTGRLNPGVIF